MTKIKDYLFLHYNSITWLLILCFFISLYYKKIAINAFCLYFFSTFFDAVCIHSYQQDFPVIIVGE